MRNRTNTKEKNVENISIQNKCVFEGCNEYAKEKKNAFHCTTELI